MHNALKDKTNRTDRDMEKKNETLSEKESILRYLKNKSNNTNDFDLKYDLVKCIEILEGKENQEYIDLKGALEATLYEKEKLFIEKCELAVELDYVKSKERRHKRKIE